MNFALCVFDLDGTLLGPNGSISSATREFLKTLRTWMRITLATGRSLSSAWPYIKELGIHEPVILYHGAVVFHPPTREVLYKASISPHAALLALQTAKNFPVDVQLYRSVEDPRIYVEALSPEILKFAQKENLPVQLISDLRSMAKEGPLKLLFIGSEESILEELRVALAGIEATVVRSERNYLEVLPPGVSKGAGLVWLCGRLGIPLGRVIAVGDQESDVSMFEVVGLGVAMTHAPPAVVAKAKCVIRDVPELVMFL